MRKIYDPVVSVGDSDVVGQDPAWTGRLSCLFDQWIKTMDATCLEATGDGKRHVRDTLRKEGTYFFPGFVGVWFYITVVEE